MNDPLLGLYIYVVSVKTFIQRQESISRQLNEAGLRYEFIFRYDPEDFSSDPPPIVFNERSNLTRGERSAVAKHAEAWRRGVEKKTELVLILEDDALLSDNFRARLGEVIELQKKLEPGFLINLGCANARTPKEFNRSDAYLRVASIETAEAYLTDFIGLKRRLDWLAHHRVNEPADHLIKKIDGHVGTIQYWTMKPLVEQGSLTGKFKSSLDENRAASNSMLIYIGYLFRKYKRRVLPQLLTRLLRRNNR